MHRSDIGASGGESAPIRDALGVADDITAQRAADEARREAEDLRRMALEASLTGTFRWDVRTHTVHRDANLERLFGLEPSTDPSSVDDLFASIHPEDRRRVLEASWLSVSEGAEIDQEFRIVRPDGQVRWLREKGKTYCDRKGVPSYVTGVCTDVTERVAAESLRERLLHLEHEARVEAERAARAREDVLAMVAHDLRNPVHAIAMAASLMDDARSSETDRKRHVALIHRAVSVMDRLLQDLLDLSRMDAGTFAVEHAPVSLRGLLRETHQMFDASAREAAIRFDCRLPDADVIIRGDYDRLLQALSNLVGNALKFTPRGGSIEVRADRIGNAVHIAVEDSGPGIPADDLPMIFDRFWQADRASRSGAGLGLPIVRGIAAAHGGRVWATSTEGKGSTFWLWLAAEPRWRQLTR